MTKREKTQTNADTSSAIRVIALKLLGGLNLRLQALEVPAPTGKVQQLLAYLLLHPRTVHPREALAELLWPEVPPERSRRNLSDTLYRLRQVAPGEWLDAGPTAISLRLGPYGTAHASSSHPDAPELQVDVWVFQQAAASADPQEWARAAQLYRGELLPDVYEDWLEPHRRGLQEQYLGVLMRLAAAQEADGALEDAHQTLLRALQTDALSEDAYRGLMRVLAKMNRISDALNMYERLVDLLEREVAAPPSHETRRLADALFSELDLARAPKQASPHDIWRPQFVGRQRERRELLAAIENAIRGQGCTLAVDGPAGIGKTRLLEEIEAGASWRGATVVWGRAGERPAESSVAPLAEAVEAALAGPRAAQVETLLDVDTLIGLAPLYAPWRALGPALELPPEQARLRFMNLVVALFDTLSALSPLVVILDDLHWADPTLWFLLDGLVEHARDMPLAVICTYRRGAVEDGPGWTYLQKWEREKQIHLYSLLPLDAHEVAALLGPARAGESELVWAGSAGNPFYVVQALAALAEGDSLQARITPARTAGLSAPAQAALHAAAVIGRTVPYALLAATVDLDPRSLIDATAELADRHLVVPMDSGYRFAHDLVQAAVYAQIEAAQQRSLHSKVAQALAQRESGALGSRAYHLEVAGELLAAGELFSQVAEEETGRFAYLEARTALIKALDYLPNEISVRHTEMLLELARLCNLTGDVPCADAALQDALLATQALQRKDLEITTRIQMADLAGRTGKHEQAETEFDAAWTLAAQLEDRPSQLAVLLPRSDFLSRIGKFEEAKTNFEHAIALAREFGDKDREGRALEGMGWVLAGLGASAEQVLDYMEQALAAHAVGGNRFEEARTRLNMFSALQNAGMWDRLLPLEKPMLEGVRRVGYRRGEASAQQALCWMHLGLGDFAAAREAGLQAQALFEEVGEFMGASLAISALGAVLVQQGAHAEAKIYLEQALGITKELGSDAFEAYAHHELGAFLLVEARQNPARYAEAKEQFLEALQRWERMGDPFNRIRTQTALALVQLGMGDRVAAIELAECAWDYLQSGLPNSMHTLAWLLSLYEPAEALGWADRTKIIIQQAYDELLRQAAQIKDDDVRRRFLHNVPVNRTVTARYDQVFGVNRCIKVRLAHRVAPMGRTLSAEDQVDVVWTLLATEDEAIQDQAQRRRFVLQRLYREAVAQDALPTDDDLAQALNVSRRTILRDIQTLAQAGIVIETRARQTR